MSLDHHVPVIENASASPSLNNCEGSDNMSLDHHVPVIEHASSRALLERLLKFLLKR
jgi:hypothetical protein